MRVGKYAIVHGVEHRALFGPSNEDIDLVIPRDHPRPEGYRWYDGMGGFWYKTVPRSAAQRLFSVVTWALYKEKFPVLLYSLDPGGKATVFYHVATSPVQFSRDPEDENGDLLVPEGFHMMGNQEGWSARVDLADLTDVLEKVTEHPLEPEPHRRHEW